MEKLIQIDPRKVEVFGYESPACLEIVISLMAGMVNKDPIPAVTLCTFDGGETYEIPYEEKNEGGGEFIWGGGHHRTLATYLLGEDLSFKPMKKSIKDQFKIPERIKIPLSNMRLERNPREFVYGMKIKKGYRMLPEPEVFCKRFHELYHKVNIALKGGTHTDYSLSREEYTEMRDRVLRLMAA